AVEPVEGGRPGGGVLGEEPVPPQVLADQGGELLVVVHDQDGARGAVHAGRLRASRGGPGGGRARTGIRILRTPPPARRARTEATPPRAGVTHSESASRRR